MHVGLGRSHRTVPESPEVKDQLFWPELAPETVATAGVAEDAIATAGAPEHGTRVDEPTEDHNR